MASEADGPNSANRPSPAGGPGQMPKDLRGNLPVIIGCFIAGVCAGAMCMHIKESLQGRVTLLAKNAPPQSIAPSTQIDSSIKTSQSSIPSARHREVRAQVESELQLKLREGKEYGQWREQNRVLGLLR